MLFHYSYYLIYQCWADSQLNNGLTCSGSSISGSNRSFRWWDPTSMNWNGNQINQEWHNFCCWYCCKQVMINHGQNLLMIANEMRTLSTGFLIYSPSNGVTFSTQRTVFLLFSNFQLLNYNARWHRMLLRGSMCISEQCAIHTFICTAVQLDQAKCVHHKTKIM